jgi:DNA helicase HerA-like ATPase
MKDRIILSKAASIQLDTAKRRLQLSGQDDYIPLRIAFGRSLQTKAVTDVPPMMDVPPLTKAKSLQLTTFEQTQGLLFKALVCQRYKRKIEGDEYVELLTKHIEHGLWLIATETEKLSGYDYITMISNVVGSKLNNAKQNIITPENQPTGIVEVKIGKEKGSQKAISYKINVANNPHFAIIGGSGAGKTYFLKHLLQEIRKSSHYETHFVIFDYKDGDIANDKNFVEKTKATVLNISQTPLPLNVFAGAQQSEQDQKRRAERIVEIVKNVEANIGKVQEENLYQAIINAYQNANPYPDFDAIREELLHFNSKPDSLTSVLRPLIEQNYFARNTQDIYQSWTNRTTIIDIHEIERKDLVCFFVLNQIYQELKQLGHSAVNSVTKARKLRIVAVIDEAHYLLQNAKRSKILMDMIREVRSMGGAVILASQSPDDYDQTGFDFLEQIQFPIVLRSNPKSSKFLQQKFMLSAQQAKEMLIDIGKLGRGEAYIWADNKPVIAELCKE